MAYRILCLAAAICILAVGRAGESAPPAPREALLLGNVIMGVAWSPDGKRLVSAGWDNTVRVWDGSSGALLKTIGEFVPRGSNPSSAMVHAIAWSSQGELAFGNHFGEVRTCDLKTEKEKLLYSHGGAVRSMRWRPDGQRLASASNDGTVRLWDGSNSTLLATSRRWGWALAWRPDGEQLAIDAVNDIELIDVPLGRIAARLKGHRDWVMAVDWHPSGKRLASAGRGGAVIVWDGKGGRKLLSRKLVSGSIDAVAWSPDGRLLEARPKRVHITLM
jgi:WD40 repeat protein